MKSQGRILSVLCIILLFALQLPFLRADPDYYLSVSRDAFTDEGLNTSQLRNYINHGYLDLMECDNMIKTPLFNVLLFLPLKFFGTHLIVARITVMLCLIVSLFLVSRNEYFSRLIPILFATTLIQYFVFQYSHFSLSEMMAVSSILLGVFFLYLFFRSQKQSQLFLSALFVSLAYFLKIQFIYIIVLLPAAVIANRVLKIVAVNHMKAFITSILFMVMFLLIFIVVWYLPFRETFRYVMSDQVSGKFVIPRRIPYTVFLNITLLLFSPQAWWFNALVIICFLIGVLMFLRSKDSSFRILFMLCCLWIFIELHKVFMLYLPSRYLVSYYFAAGMMCSVVIRQLLSQQEAFWNKISLSRLRTAGIILLAVFFIGNSIQYAILLGRREYNIQTVNNYFSSTLKNSEQPIMGVWSTNTTWDCKARCIPVWSNFMNDKDLFNRFHPQAILSESDERESNQAYSLQGIDLKHLSDSMRSFQIGQWKVNVYWMR